MRCPVDLEEVDGGMDGDGEEIHILSAGGSPGYLAGGGQPLMQVITPPPYPILQDGGLLPAGQPGVIDTFLTGKIKKRR